MQLDTTPPPELTAYLQQRGWIPEEVHVVATGPAGEGNMNLVRRAALSNGASLILKQGRPWVEKYPTIPAPAERTVVEGAFYVHVRPWLAVAERMPALFGLDVNDHLLALEDCAGRDLTSLYAGASVAPSDLGTLAAYLTALHAVPLEAAAQRALANHEMRALNHEHIFALPLRADNGLALDSICDGLEDAARPLRDDEAFIARVHALGREYLEADGPALLHGDFFPGSWLDTSEGLKVIDPEFCFPGPPDFDLGICLAHFRLAGLPAALSGDLLDRYGHRYDDARVSAWAGVEMMRRLLGVAQLPLTADLATRRAWLADARRLVLGELSVAAQ